MGQNIVSSNDLIPTLKVSSPDEYIYLILINKSNKEQSYISFFVLLR